MWCKRCVVPPNKFFPEGRRGGRVFVDRIFSEKRHVELFCIKCGKRWMIDKDKNKLATKLLEIETAHENAVTLR